MQAPRARYDTLTNYLIQNCFQHDIIDDTLLIKKSGSHIILALVYVDDIIFVSTVYAIGIKFVDIMTLQYEMSMMDELTFFVGLQVKQLPNDILIFQRKICA